MGKLYMHSGGRLDGGGGGGNAIIDKSIKYIKIK
jgi:hypothetical protein